MDNNVVDFPRAKPMPRRWQDRGLPFRKPDTLEHLMLIEYWRANVLWSEPELTQVREALDDVILYADEPVSVRVLEAYQRAAQLAHDGRTDDTDIARALQEFMQMTDGLSQAS
ncbi:MAG: hypothetical protein ACXWKB_09030 [Methyloceanibacter sp.]